MYKMYKIWTEEQEWYYAWTLHEALLHTDWCCIFKRSDYLTEEYNCIARKAYNGC